MAQARKAWASAEDAFDPGYATGGADAVRHQLHQLRAEVLAAKWAGRTGPTDRAVALALLDRATANGAWTIKYSVRDLAPLIGAAPPAASRALKRLHERHGFLKEPSRSTGTTTAKMHTLNLGWSSSAPNSLKVLQVNHPNDLPVSVLVSSP